MKTSPAKTPFQMCPFSTDTRPGKSRTPPDRCATPYYVESFQFQHGSMGSKSKISKVFSKTLPRSQFPGLTANDMNNALLTLLWNLSMVQNGLKSMCFARGYLKKVQKTSSDIAVISKTCLQYNGFATFWLFRVFRLFRFFWGSKLNTWKNQWNLMSFLIQYVLF